MTREALIEQLGQLNLSRRGHRPALYKPLLLLLLLSRILERGVRQIAFGEVEQGLRALIERYSPEDSPESVGQPWWHLPTDGLWRVLDERGVVVREAGTPRGDLRVPPLDQLRHQYGEFAPEIRELLTRDPDAISFAMNFLLERYFSDPGPSPRAEFPILLTGRSAVDRITPPRELGQPYSNAGELRRSVRRDPFEVDPDVIDRGNQAHASTVDSLADFLRSRNIEPRIPDVGDPMFDLAWRQEGSVFVAEIKSVTAFNEEKQLRLGLGQLLRYRQELEKKGFKAVAVLVPEREPEEPGWIELCDALGVTLVWPGTFHALERSRLQV